MLDLVIRNGRCATSSDVFDADLGVQDGMIVRIGRGLSPGRREIDAAGRWVLPGGIDSHVHVDQRKTHGGLTADTFRTGSMAAACGGTTTIVPFAAQHRGQSLRWAIGEYHARAAGQAVIDYNFHLIVAEPTDDALERELPEIVAGGCTSLKIFTTYDALKLGDAQTIAVLEAARREGALVMAHCENTDGIAWTVDRLIGRGKTEPRYQAGSRPSLFEREAAHRVATFAELIGTPIMVVHVSGPETIDVIRAARARGAIVRAETCPHYLVLDAGALDGPGIEGAKAMCSPPLRPSRFQAPLWAGVADGFFDVVSSDHSPYRFDETGKFPHGRDVPFNRISNGLPGVETRLPILFSEGVNGGRIDINRFVALASTNAAKIYGLHPRKGSIAIGSDADLCIWDADREVTLANDLLHHAVDYTPYEGMRVRGWPAVTICRGEVVAQGHEFVGPPGHGRFVPAARIAGARHATAAQREMAELGASLS